MSTRIAVAFPGQGAERMATPATYASFRDDETIAIASHATGVDVARAFERGERALEKTAVLQPAIVALALAAWSALRRAGVAPSFVCGHSVGEVAAWSASGAIDARDAIALARARGEAMDAAARVSPGRMIAISAPIDRVLATAPVEIAARNGPSQTVFSGGLDAIATLETTFGGRRIDVAGPWHSRAMHVARDATVHALAAVAPRSSSIPLVTCLDGRVLAPNESPDLAAQLTSPVAWDAVMSTLAREHVTDIICIAPGRVNRGLLRDGLGTSVRLHLADTHDDIERIATRISEGTHDRASSRV